MGITGETQVAVLIQELVPAEVAGVLFTCDPLSGRRDRWIVEACWGLGEAVVEGLVTPDHYTLTPGGALLARQLGSKEMAIIPDAQGGTRQHPVSDPARARLAALGAACEDLFGPAQDIEWALVDTRFSLLQCRPITNGGHP
jgi:phosphoenolpyruvate synthase/pyruvate phosphate dikinase